MVAYAMIQSEIVGRINFSRSLFEGTKLIWSGKDDTQKSL